MERAKPFVWLVWIGSLAAMLFGSGWVATAGHAVFWLTLVAHVVECFTQRDVFERAGGPLSGHVVQTLIYGFFHWMPIKRRLDEAGAP